MRRGRNKGRWGKNKENNAIKHVIYSIRNGKKIPLKEESFGTKRMVSFLSALYGAYNDENVTLVIDEIDSGVYEVLLGKLLLAFKNGGKGQLIFTSHNLRPLEVLSPKQIKFTKLPQKEEKQPGEEGVKEKTEINVLDDTTIPSWPNGNLRDSYIKRIENIYLDINKEDEYLKIMRALTPKR